MKPLSALATVLLSVVLYSAPVVDLTIREKAGIARADEDVTMGVPLPENGFYTDITRFTLRDEGGSVIPCEIKKITNWYKNPQCIRWIQLNFPYTLVANDSQVVTLSYDDAPYVLPSGLSVQENGSDITVNTGKIRFIVRKPNFNLLDQVWVDESGLGNFIDTNKVVISHNRGIVHWSNNVEYLSSLDPASTVVIERQGPGVVTLKATGKLKSAANDSTFAFVTRIYAYNNSPSVKIYNTVELRDGAATRSVPIQGIHLEIPLSLSAPRTAAVGKEGGSVEAALTAGQDAFCMVKRPVGSPTTAGTVISGSIGGTVTASTFSPKTTKPRDLGWVALYDGTRGCVAAMKYFWQMVPTSVEAFGDGTLLLGAFSKRAQQTPYNLFVGTARSCETRWSFFNSATPEQMRSRAAGATDRLYAVAAPFWYTRRTKSLVNMVEANPSLYTPAIWNIISTWENKLNSDWTTVLDADDNYYSIDSYGFMEWGDNPHYNQGGSPPCNILWNGNYYGLDFFAFEQFYHTGDLRFLQYGIAHARHVADIHTIHMGEGSALTGSSRYCPPADHINIEECTPSLNEMSHHKTEGLFAEYYLTGNDYALSTALDGVNWAASLGFSFAVGPSDNTRYPRRWAHDMFSIVCGYEYNQDARYYNLLWQNWEIYRRLLVPPNTPDNSIGHSFCNGLPMEAMVKMSHIIGPEYVTNKGVHKPDSIGHFLKIYCDSVWVMPRGITGEGECIVPNVTIGYAFLGQERYYGPAYLSKAATMAAIAPSMGNLHKDFVKSYRNFTQAMTYFAIPDSINAYAVDAEKALVRRPALSELEMDVSPTPFNPSTRIKLSGAALAKGAKVDLRIYALDGTLVEDLSNRVSDAGHAVVWSAPASPSRVYVIRCRVGNKMAVQKTMVLK